MHTTQMSDHLIWKEPVSVLNSMCQQWERGRGLTEWWQEDISVLGEWWDGIKCNFQRSFLHDSETLSANNLILTWSPPPCRKVLCTLFMTVPVCSSTHNSALPYNYVQNINMTCDCHHHLGHMAIYSWHMVIYHVSELERMIHTYQKREGQSVFSPPKDKAWGGRKHWPSQPLLVGMPCFMIVPFLLNSEGTPYSMQYPGQGNSSG